MLNNLTNFFNLFTSNRFKRELEDTDVIAIGTQTGPRVGSYKPTAIQFKDLKEQLDISKPIETDGSTITGDGTLGNPLVGFSGDYEDLANKPISIAKELIFRINPTTGNLRILKNDFDVVTDVEIFSLSLVNIVFKIDGLSGEVDGEDFFIELSGYNIPMGYVVYGTLDLFNSGSDLFYVTFNRNQNEFDEYNENYALVKCTLYL